VKIEQISSTMHRIVFEETKKEIYLIGTAHVSQQSVDEVVESIDTINPDCICVELDEGRYRSKTEKQNWENLNIKKVLKENKGFLLLANMALSSYQKRLGAQLGVNPGDEIMVAADLANERDIPLVLCDREIQVTFKRAWRLSNWWNKAKLIATLLTAVFSDEKISSEELEKLKETNILQSLLDELAQELPTVKKVLIDERDQYLASKIYQAEGNKIVAVVGAGHVPGLIEHIKSIYNEEVSVDTQQLIFVPPKTKAAEVASWVVLAAILAIIGIGFARSGFSGGLSMFLYWFALNSSLTALASIISLAHPVTIILATLAAPITALSPTLGVGMVAALVEVTVRKPRVKDFEQVNDDIVTFKGWFSNRIIHALLIFVMTSIFASIGTFIAFPMLISRIGG
jgi:pheromone shutdown-related protein TraB